MIYSSCQTFREPLHVSWCRWRANSQDAFVMVYFTFFSYGAIVEKSQYEHPSNRKENSKLLVKPFVRIPYIAC